MARRIVLVLFVGLLVHAGGTVTLAAAAEEPSLDGVYICKGTSLGGKTYQGLVEIVRQGDSFQLMWTFSPEEMALGVGILRDRVLAVSYYGRVAGVVMYRVQNDGTLIGDWTVLGGDGAVFTETLSRLPAGAERRAPGRRRPAAGRVAHSTAATPDLIVTGGD